MIMDYICGICYMPAQYLRLGTLDSEAESFTAAEGLPWTEIELVRGRAVPLEVEETLKDGVRLFTTKFTAVQANSLLLPDCPLAFKAKCVNGRTFLVGLPERPFPVHTRRWSLPERYSEAPKFTLSVEWTSRFPSLTLL